MGKRMEDLRRNHTTISPPPPPYALLTLNSMSNMPPFYSFLCNLTSQLRARTFSSSFHHLLISFSTTTISRP